MPLVNILDLGKAFGPDDIFMGLTASVPHRARIGIVGANGVGKTTLLRILAKEDVATEGTVHHAKNLRIGYLPQESVFESSLNLWEECLTVYKDLLSLEAEVNRLAQAMSENHASEELIEAYGKRQAEFERLGGYRYDTDIRITLTGLGFIEKDYQRPLEQFSGGERTRVLLAKLLLSSPDLLLLDEPTNHLDINAIEWLESFLRDWEGAALIVSHDRYFLDQVVSVVWEMTPVLELYRGNYSAYLQQRSERYERRLKEYEAQQEFIDKEQEYITRHIEGQNTRQAQGRRKRLERLLKESQLARPIDHSRTHLHINLAPVVRSGDLVLRTYDLKIGYHDDGEVLFNVPDLVAKRGECIAIIGPNGAGKTTFLKTVLQQLPPLAGKTQLGANLQLGYFAQAHEGLVAENSLMEEIERFAPEKLPAEIRNYLARYMFTEDDVFRTVDTLSGGERGRLALAVLALTSANLLLLDEPTNHLDLPSQEVLQTVLSEFRGTILLVTHDRYLVDALATQIWEVKPQEKTLELFDGTYSQYKSWQAAQNALAQEQNKSEKSRQVEPQRGLRAVTREERERKKRQYQLELEIAETEALLQTLGQKLEHPPRNLDDLHQLTSEYGKAQKQLDRLFNEWASLAEQGGTDTA
ncbi:MAG: ABC-F family ATP-binding cassette domain-containing protein [Anaerolineae bacterium]|nr:ABC-F family ATP-binding cassette domain-containing protein [Anaerolineae bacterium]